MYGHRRAGVAGDGLRAGSRTPITADWIAATRFEVGVGDRRVGAHGPGPWYDPKNERIRA